SGPAFRSLNGVLPHSRPEPCLGSGRRLWQRSAGFPAGHHCSCHSSRSGENLFGSRESCSSGGTRLTRRSEEHTSELQSLAYLVCRLLLEKKKKKKKRRLPPFMLTYWNPVCTASR